MIFKIKIQIYIDDLNTVSTWKATTPATSSALQKNEIEHPLSPKPPLTPGTVWP